MEENRILELLGNLDKDTKEKLSKPLTEINEDESSDVIENKGVLNASDARLAKIIAAAMKIAEEKDPEYTSSTESVYELAGDADQVADHINVAEKMINGEMTPEEATTFLIDKAQSRLVTFLEDSIDAGVPKVADKISEVLIHYCPASEEYIPIIKDTIYALQPGLKALATVAVNIGTQKLKDYLPVVARKIKDKVLN